MSNLVELSLPPGARGFTDDLIEAGGLPHGFAIVGGTARQALLEARHGVWQPARDIDVIGLEEFGADMDLAHQIKLTVSTGVNHEDGTTLRPGLDDWFTNATDFGLNATSIARTEEGVRIITTETAIEDADAGILQLTAEAVRRVNDLDSQKGTEAKTRYSRERTNLPARGAYFKAVISELLGREFVVDVSGIRLPNPRTANPFFIGLMLTKAFQMDAITRKNVHAQAYMNNIEQLNIWRFTTGRNLPHVALQGLVRRCPSLRARAEHPSVTHKLP